MHLRTVIEDFYNEHRYEAKSPATITFHRDNFQHFIRDTRAKDPEDLKASLVRRWLLDHDHLSRATLATYDRALRVLPGNSRVTPTGISSLPMG